MERRRGFNKVIIFGILFLMILSSSVICFAAVDLSKDIAALKEEIKAAQAKIDRAKAGETLEKITIPVSIKNMQKILGSLSQKAGDAKNLAEPINNLNKGLKTLEKATHSNDRAGAQKALSDMAAALKALEAEASKEDKQKTIQKIPGPIPLSTKTQNFLKLIEQAGSLGELDRALKDGNFTQSELKEIESEVKKPPYINKVQSLLDKAKSEAKAKAEAKAKQLTQEKQREHKQKHEQELRRLNNEALGKLQALKAKFGPPKSPRPTVAGTSPEATPVSPMRPRPASFSILPFSGPITENTTNIRILGLGFGNTTAGRSVKLHMGIRWFDLPIQSITNVEIRVTVPNPSVVREAAFNAVDIASLTPDWNGRVPGFIWIEIEGEGGVSREIYFQLPRSDQDEIRNRVLPHISSVSVDEIWPGQTIVIEGRNFLGTPGSVSFGIGPQSYVGQINEWHENYISVTLPSNVTGQNRSFCIIRVQNNRNFRSNFLSITFRIPTEVHVFWDYCNAWSVLLVFGNIVEECTLHNFLLQNGYTVKSEYHESGYVASAVCFWGHCYWDTLPQIGSNNPRVVVRAESVGGLQGWSCYSYIEVEGPPGLPYR